MANRLLKCSKCGLIIGTYPKYCQYCGGEPMTTDENPHIVPVPRSAAPGSASRPKPASKSRSSFSMWDDFYGSPFSGFNSTVKAPKSERERLIDLLSAGCTLVVVATASVMIASWFSDKYGFQRLATDQSVVLADTRAGKQDSPEAMAEYQQLSFTADGGGILFGESLSMTLPEGWYIDSGFINDKVVYLANDSGFTANLSVLDNGRFDRDEMVTAWHYAFEMRQGMEEQYPDYKDSSYLSQVRQDKLYAPKYLNAAEFELSDASIVPMDHRIYRTFSGKSLLLSLEVRENGMNDLDAVVDELAHGIKVLNVEEESSSQPEKRYDFTDYQDFTIGGATLTPDMNYWTLGGNDSNYLRLKYDGPNESYVGSAYFEIVSIPYPGGEKHGSDFANERIKAHAEEYAADGWTVTDGTDFVAGDFNAPSCMLKKDGQTLRMLVVTDEDQEYHILFGGEGDAVYDLGNDLYLLLDSFRIGEQSGQTDTSE